MSEMFAGLDVSDVTTAICVVDNAGATVFETSVNTNPTAICAALRPYKQVLGKVGFESGTKSNWLYKELDHRRLPVVCLDALRTHAALSAQRNKTDRIDAKGIATILCSGRYTRSYVKADDALEARLVLLHRSALVRKAADLDLVLRATLKERGARLVKRNGKLELKFPRGGRNSFLAQRAQSMLRAIRALKTEIASHDALISRIVRADPVCKRLMTVPGVGPLTALTFKAGVDDPGRFRSSRTVGVYFGLTPRRHQSGRTDFSGHISRRGDPTVRALLYEAAFSMLFNAHTNCAMKKWAVQLKLRRGSKRATVALSRKLATLLHRMWVTGSNFDPAQGG
jgi:transposase